MVTVNSAIVGAIVWVLGLILKQIKGFPNDMIPQVTYYASIVTAYLLEILKGLGATPASAATDGFAAAMVPDQAVEGSFGFVFANIWDWVGRKLIWEKLLKKK